MNRDGASCPRGIPLRIPESNSVVDINDGDEKGKSSCVINSIHTGSNSPLVPSFPCSFSHPAFWNVKGLISQGSKGFNTSPNGALQLGQPRSHCDICKLPSALLCPALFINIFLSTQHGVHFAAYRTWSTNDPHPDGKRQQTPWRAGCGWTFLDPYLLGTFLWGAPTWTITWRVCWERINFSHNPAVTVFLYIGLEITLRLILHWSSRLERLLPKHKQFRSWPRPSVMGKF